MFFYVVLFFGISLMIFGVRKQRVNRLRSRFMNKNAINKINPIKVYFYRYIHNIYDVEYGFKRNGLILFIFLMAVLLVGNELFLELNFILALIVSFVVSIYVIDMIETKRLRDDFEKNFSQVLVILNGAISAGSNIQQALNDSVNSIDGVLKVELYKIVRALEIGDDPSKVFEASFRRLPFKNYYFFLTALNVSMSSGAKLKEILSRLAMIVTKAKSIEKKKNAMTSEARMSSKITAAIPFVFLILMKFISPENFDYILHDDRGRYILYYFIGSEIIGMLIVMFLMRKIS